ncbi:uncharacterized protein LOC123315098 [Coccinella septempunctata]|uniref:uncharacterized protein LOC123315098 n=1 Tax=Coccinella septempunctata TaxID=41139 RepID=UPI001D070ABE|nr:uncharacterized protein LOC123315098 [Coccinella septempunctata]
MNEIEDVILKNIFAVVEYIPKHKSMWEEFQQDIIVLLQILQNQKEELIHTESVRSNILNTQNFKELKEALLQVIIEEIDESLIRIKNKMNHLKHINDDMKSHIEKLEKSSLEFDWHSTSKILDGNEYQPPLSELLQLCLEYRTFILKYTDEIFHTFDMIDIRNGETLKKLEDSVKFDDLIVRKLIAITQYLK